MLEPKLNDAVVGVDALGKGVESGDSSDSTGSGPVTRRKRDNARVLPNSGSGEREVILGALLIAPPAAVVVVVVEDERFNDWAAAGKLLGGAEGPDASGLAEVLTAVEDKLVQPRVVARRSSKLKTEEDFVARAGVDVVEGSAGSEPTANDCLLRGVAEFWDWDDCILVSFAISITRLSLALLCAPGSSGQEILLLVSPGAKKITE